MADLSAVLRKTIDGLPGATPQLRAKVYEKARAAISRQISLANPPLAEDVAGGRIRALEDAIAQTEDHYLSLEAGQPADGEIDQPMSPAAPMGHAPERESQPSAPQRHEAGAGAPLRPASGEVGEVGPASPRGDATAAHDADAEQANQIPAPDMQAPRYPTARKPVSGKKSKAPVLALAGIVLLAGIGGAVYFSSMGAGDVAPDTEGQPQTAQTTDAGETPDQAALTEPPAEAISPGEAAAPGTDAATPGATPAPTTQEPGAREFTQRLQPDGTEIDEGAGASTANVFDEGTDVSAATPATTNVPSTPAPASAPVAANVPEGAEVAVFYEERFNATPGSQHAGNVRWSIINEAPGEGQPPEPAIRAVVEVPDRGLSMTMTIRRNGDATLPASHVIEMLFQTPETFPGGGIETVQRLALKPTEQDRGRPLIGVAGKISDGFFWIALNDLQQAVDDNLNLMANEQWIDIPIAYDSGQRALLSLEKGSEGQAVFQQAIDAWAART